MAKFTHEPEISATHGIVQTIKLLSHDENISIGAAIWHADALTFDGVIQILEFQIDPTSRRQGFGKLLMGELVRQATAYQSLRKIPLRRLWISLRQKKQIQARAFVSSVGFIHLGTVKELLTDEDAMIYVRTFD